MMAAHPAPVSFLRGGGKALKAVSDPQRGPTKFFPRGKKLCGFLTCHKVFFPGKNNFVDFQKFIKCLSLGKKHFVDF